MITFQNKGLIDLRALKTFGVSAKDNEAAIGYFGTGLKYAIAILLREGHEVTLYRSRKKYVFKAKKTKIRNDHFQIVTMNDEELGFTTALGRDWELWQAFRELWCNTIDEFGEVARMETKGEAGMTTVTVDGEAFEEVYDRRETVILIDEADLHLDGVEVRHRPSEYLYYRGIRVQKLRHASKMTYNITRALSLTEDRTIRYSWDPLNLLKNAVVRCTDVNFITQVLTSGDETYEGSFDFSDLTQDPGPMFLATAGDLRGRYINASATKLAREAMRRELEEHHSQELEGVPATQLARAKEFCKNIGLSMESYSIIVVEALEDGAAWLCEGKKIFLTPDLFVKGTRDLTLVLMEANLQEFGALSRSRILIDKLLALGEKIDGEPL